MSKRRIFLLLTALVALLLTVGPSVYPYASALVARWGSGAGETDELRMDASTNALITIDYPHHEVHGGSHYYIEGHVTLADGNSLYVKLDTPNTTTWSHFTWEIESSGILETTLYEGASGGMAGGARGTIHANHRNKNCWSGSHTGGNNEATVLTDSTQAWTIDALIGMQVFNQTDGSSAFITDNTADTLTVAAMGGGTDNDFDTSDVYEVNNSQMIVTANVAVAATLGLEMADHKVGGTGFKTVTGGGESRTDEIVLRQNETYLRYFLSGSADNIISFKATWYEHSDKN